MAIQKIAPSGSYNGTEASGWLSGEPTASAARVRTDAARPALAPLYPYNGQAFTGDYRVAALAFARGGIASVKFHFEGTTITVETPEEISIVGDDGVTRKVVAYAVDLDHAATVSGWCRLYIESVPTDPAKNGRIIGPFSIKRKAGSLWDVTLDFGPGEALADLKAAILAAKGPTHNTKDHIRLRPTTTHTYDIGAGSGFNAVTPHTKKGIVKVLPDDGVTFTIGRTTWINNGVGVSFRPYMEGLTLGKGVRIDFHRISQFQVESGHRPHHLAGAEVFSSNVLGCYELFGTGKGTGTAEHGLEKYPRAVQVLAEGTLLTEVHYHDVKRGPTSCQMVRWCDIHDLGEDVLSFGRRFDWSLQLGNTVQGISAWPFRDATPAFTLVYAGAAATVTYSVSGTNDGSNRVFTVTIDGVSTNTAIASVHGNANYFISDLVATINAIDPGLTATLIDDGRRAASVGGIGAVSPTSIKGVERTIPCAFDQHGDMWQTATGGNDTNDSENVIIIGNRVESDGVQTFFLSFQASPVDGRDIFFINNAVYCLNGYEPGNDAVSQAQGPQSHVCHWHNTLVGQRYTLRTDMSNWQKYTPDAECEYYGNVYREFRWDGITPTANNDVVIRYNHFLEGTVPAGSGVSNNGTGGSWSAAFPEIATGDFTPAGTLAESLITPAVPFDINWSKRASLSAKGATIAVPENGGAEPIVSNFTIRVTDSRGVFTDRAFSITTKAA